MQVDSSGLEQGSASGTAGVALPSRVWLIALAPAVLTSTLLAALAVCTHYCYKSTSSEQRKRLLAHGSLSGDGSSRKSSGGSGGGAGAGGGFCGVLRLRSARMLLLCCFAFMISFNSFMFLAAWVVQHITGSAWLVQVSGFFFMAPMLLGPFLGKVADRCDKRAMEAVVLGAVTVVSCLVTAAMQWVETGIVSPEVMDHRGSARSVWLAAIYAHAAVVGIGMPAFQCTHLPRIKAAVGEEAATAANAAAMSCFGAGGLIGSQLGGLIVEHLGVAGGYAVASGWTLLAFLLLFTAPSEGIIHVAGRATASRSHSSQAALAPQPYQPQMQDVLATVAAAESDVQPATSTTLDKRCPPPSIWMLLRNRAYFGVLGVTVLANLLFWGHIPFVQVLAARLGSTPSQAGLLSSATGAGNLFGCVCVVALNPKRIGLVFALGMGSASAMLAIAAVDSYWCCLTGLFLANACGGGFAATQATLVMQAIPDYAHGLGMGTLTLAIGAQAVGMLLIGAMSEEVGPATTLLLLSGVGCGAQLVFSLALPECSRMTRQET